MLDAGDTLINEKDGSMLQGTCRLVGQTGKCTGKSNNRIYTLNAISELIEGVLCGHKKGNNPVWVRDTCPREKYLR